VNASTSGYQVSVLHQASYGGHANIVRFPGQSLLRASPRVQSCTAYLTCCSVPNCRCQRQRCSFTAGHCAITALTSTPWLASSKRRHLRLQRRKMGTEMCAKTTAAR
jgi:hypothetical protein